MALEGYLKFRRSDMVSELGQIIERLPLDELIYRPAPTAGRSSSLRDDRPLIYRRALAARRASSIADDRTFGHDLQSDSKKMSNIYIHQIYHDDATKAQLDAGFLPLDNSKNERPDWYEYHPIRTFLLSHTLEDDAYYGFFSARFKSKTSLSANDVESFVKTNDGADIVLFCPVFSESAFFLSVFEQGDCRHPGLMQATQEFAQSIGIHTNLSTIVTKSSDTIFANYFVAKRSFWGAWFQLAEELYRRAEELSPGSVCLDKTNGVPETSSRRAKSVYHGEIGHASACNQRSL